MAKREYRMSSSDMAQLKGGNPKAVVDRMKAAGIEFVSEECPIKLKQPYEHFGDPDTGEFVYTQE